MSKITAPPPPYSNGHSAPDQSLSALYSPYYGAGEIETEELENRGEAWSGILEFLTSGLLRIGFLIQLVVIITGFVLYYLHGGTGIFTFDLFSTPEALRNNVDYTQLMIILQGISLVGTLNIAGFQIYTADNSKETRGFRAGSKMLCTAATLDSFVVALRLMQHFYAYNFLASRWWMKYTQSNADWCLFYSSALVHSLALALYGLAIFYMESYHACGKNEQLAWICLSLFFLSSALELLLVLARLGGLLTVAQMLALAAACLWSCSFEPATHDKAAKFHDRDVNQGMIVEE